MKRFAGSLAALGLLCGVLWLVWRSPEAPPEGDLTLLRFEPTSLVGVELVRGPERLSLQRSAGGWEVDDGRWRPSRLVMRRIVHQLHALEARAVVAAGGAGSSYGLGPEAPVVHLHFDDSTSKALRVGDANPSGASHYVQVLPGKTVYLVQRAAVDMFAEPLESFREDRITWTDNADVVRFRLRVGTRTLDAEVVSGDWRVRRAEPPVGEVDPEVLRLLLGRLTSLRASRVVADAPPSLAPFGLADGADLVEINVADGVGFTLRVGPAGDDGRCLVHIAEDRAIYEVSCGFWASVPPPE